MTFLLRHIQLSKWVHLRVFVQILDRGRKKSPSILNFPTIAEKHFYHHYHFMMVSLSFHYHHYHFMMVSLSFHYHSNLDERSLFCHFHHSILVLIDSGQMTKPVPIVHSWIKWVWKPLGGLISKIVREKWLFYWDTYSSLSGFICVYLFKF